MSSYLQVGTNWMIDKKTLKLVPFSRLSKLHTPYLLEVPFFMWEYPDFNDRFPITGFDNIGGAFQNRHSTVRYTTDLELNRLKISFPGGQSQQAYISFFDKHENKDFQFELVSSDKRGVIWTKKGSQQNQVTGVDYTLTTVSGKSVKYSTDFGLLDCIGPHFRPITGLAKDNRYSYGLTPNQFKVRYMDEELNGTSLAIVFGHWAILLEDDLTFDTLVLLKGAKSDELNVERFVYTTNVYILKIMLLNSK